ncbi:hypothetical protein [Spirulina subsalsa]|uniref:hypothetical protein n=1 Tax=Spirulina subsalsa TaxID=54311 RepID=UPI0002D2F05A|nr:hypothetical protein [Spirulina subsalsa]
MLDIEKNNNHKNTEEYLYDLLERIKKRPGMYLGRVSLIRLKMLLLGYSMSREELGLELTQQEKQFSQFQNWIQEKYNVNSSEGWENIILSQVNDERLAFELFFELFEQFSLARFKG